MLSLSDGDGTYKFVVCKNVSDTKYASVLSASISVKLPDVLSPFLRPNQYVNYTENSEVVKLAQELFQYENKGRSLSEHADVDEGADNSVQEASDVVADEAEDDIHPEPAEPVHDGGQVELWPLHMAS